MRIHPKRALKVTETTDHVSGLVIEYFTPVQYDLESIEDSMRLLVDNNLRFNRAVMQTDATLATVIARSDQQRCLAVFRKRACGREK